MLTCENAPMRDFSQLEVLLLDQYVFPDRGRSRVGDTMLASRRERGLATGERSCLPLQMS